MRTMGLVKEDMHYLKFAHKICSGFYLYKCVDVLCNYSTVMDGVKRI